MTPFNMEDRKVIAGVDLGTSHVRTVIGILSPGGIEIAGSAQTPHKGLHKGRIVNMKESSEAIRQSTEEAEVTAGLQITQLFLSINGDYNMFSSQGMAIIPSRQVTKEDVSKAVETAKAVPLPSGHRLLHVLPKHFTVDGENPVFNPLGLAGLRLETNVLMVSMPESSVQNVLQCLRYAGHSARGLILQPLGLSLAILNDDDKKSGVCVLDIGQDQSSLTVILEGRIHYIGSFAIGGEDFTHDLMIKLKTARDKAEEIKLQYGKHSNTENDNKELDHHKDINEVLTTRAELLFQEVRSRLESLRYFEKLKSGMVLAGGGAMMSGLLETARFVMDMPVKTANIQGLSGAENLNPELAGALGLLFYIQQENTLDYRSDHLEGKVLKIKRWVQDLLP